MTSSRRSTRNRTTALSYLGRLKDGSIRPQDRLIFYIRLARNHIVKDEALDWMFENWDWLRKEEGDKTIADYPRYVASIIRRPAEAEKYRQFFQKYEDEPILSRDIQFADAEFDSRLKLIAADQAAIFRYLAAK